LRAAAAVVAAMLLGGCTGDSDKRVKVRMWAFPMIPELRDHEMYEELVEAFTREHPEIDVQVEMLPWAGRQQKMITALAGDRAPDCVYLNLDVMPRFAKMGKLRDVNEDLSAEEKADYHDAVIEGVTMDGGMYMVPMLRTVAAGLYNKDLFAQAGLDPEKPPLTWDELEAASKAITRDTDGDGTIDQWGLAYVLGGDTLNMTFWPLLWQAGGDVLSADDGSAAFNNTAGVDALEFVTRQFRDGRVPKSFVGLGGNEFPAGKVGYWLGVGQFELMQLRRDAPNLKVGVGPVLTHKARSSYSTIGGFGVFTTTRHAKETLLWLRFITRPDNMRTFCRTTNFIPTKRSLGLIYADDPLLGALEREAAYCRPDVKSEFARQIMQKVAPEVQAAALGQKDAAAALNTAAEAVNALLVETK